MASLLQHDSASHATLLVHDGELADVCSLLAGIGTPLVERRGGLAREDEGRGWDLVLASARRIVELPPALQMGCTRIAVLGEDSKTLRSMLRRSGIDLIVRRPFHPSALRLLVIHCLYRGPEKRRNRRVSVGAEIQYRAGGFRKRPAMLADLSGTGARLFSEHAIPTGRKVTLLLGGDVTEGRPLSVTGRALRAVVADPSARHEIAVSFERLSGRVRRRLDEVVDLHRGGPAMLDRDTAERLAAFAEVGADAPSARLDSRSPAAPGAKPSEADRRQDPRHALERCIIALGIEAARVLVGRDISLGGMRVDAEPSIGVGDRLQLALHVRAREQPLVVSARVTRDDGDDGMVLQFVGLDDGARRYLERMVNFLPILAMRDADEYGEGLVISEILEREGSNAAAAS